MSVTIAGFVIYRGLPIAVGSHVHTLWLQRRWKELDAMLQQRGQKEEQSS